MNAFDRDALIRAALTPPRETTPPADLAAAIHDRLVATPQRSDTWWARLWPSRPGNGDRPRLVASPGTWLVATLLLLAALLAIAVASQPSATPRDVLTYHGNAAQTGVMPGPGPAGAPRIGWTMDLHGPMTAFTMPILRGDDIIAVDARGTVSVVDVATGVLRWERPMPGRVSGTPAIADDLVVVAAEDGTVVGSAIDSGEESWRNELGVSTRASLAMADGLVLVGGDDGQIRMLDPADGGAVRSVDVRGPVVRSPAVVDGVAYAVADGGWVTAFDVATGAVRWQLDLGPGEIASPAVADGTMYVTHGVLGGSEPYALVALDVTDGKERWRWEPPTADRLFVGAVGDGVVFATSEDHGVYRIDAASGLGQRLFTAGGMVGSLPTLVGATLYIVSADGAVQAVDQTTGAVHWRMGADGAPTAPVVSGGRVIVATDRGVLMAIVGS